MASNEQRRLTKEDAMTYLKLVKQTFCDNDAKYREFEQVMIGHKNNRLDTAEVIARVEVLFMGHPDLLSGFNNFLPLGYKIGVPTDALAYIERVKQTFRDDRSKYEEFLQITKDFKNQRINIMEVMERVELLFKGHPNLVLAFNHFLPQGYKITVPDAEILSEPCMLVSDMSRLDLV